MRIHVALITVAVIAIPSIAGNRVDNFELLDHRGDAHELYYLSDAKAVVLMAHKAQCAAASDAYKSLDAIAQRFGAKGVEVRLVNSHDADHRAGIAADIEALGIGLAVLDDDTQLIGEALDFDQAGAAIVIDTANWQTVYRGDVAGIEQTLGAMMNGAQVAQSSAAMAPTCDVHYPASDTASHAQISYSQTIAPMLADNCVTCHREGGIAPWQMTDYNMVRGFAPMIREVIRTKRMPPWHADPQHGKFANDRSLSVEERQTLVHWVEAGAPRGSGPDPLATYEHDWPEWALGTPDLIIDIPSQDVPASGVVDYQYPTVANPLEQDNWVRATEIIPGDRAALHHVITRFSTATGERRFAGRNSSGLGGYVPGAIANEYPQGTGRLLPGGAMFQLQMHYTPYGKPTTDHSRLGIYFHDEEPTHKLSGAVLLNARFKIPANTKAHTAKAERVFDNDVLLYSMLPHSHYRGIASSFVAYYPDGTEEILLSVPNYDFNWQTTYRLETPKLIPAGTRVVHSTTWDNSAQNPANPDPNTEVGWGQQSWNEMLFGSMTFRVISENEGEGIAAVAE